MAIKSSIKLDPNEDITNYYLNFLETAGDKSELESLKEGMKNNNNNNNNNCSNQS